MAAKSFLTSPDLEDARARLRPPPVPPDGEERKAAEFGAHEFSAWLIDRLHARLSSHPDWTRSGPIALGSWSRGELCPKSDIDLLFCGDEVSVHRLVGDFAREGLRIRSRTPEDLEDWTKGVLPFDVLALLDAIGLTPEAAEKLRGQVLKLSPGFRIEILRAMTAERKSRTVRYDSISNFLEPNLKYGPGGLRDLEQALVTRRLFQDRFDDGGGHAFEVLNYYKQFFLTVRQKLHLADGGGEVLSAPEQKPLADWLQFSETRDFMREIQKGVSRVSFYADWVVESVGRSRAQVARIREVKISSVEGLLKALTQDPSILMQNRARLLADQLFAEARRRKRAIDREIGRVLTEVLDPAKPEAAMNAFFRSRVIDHCVPEFRKIVGYVQHDQYHRFSVDAHLLQVLREIKRLRKRPHLSSGFRKILSQLTKKDWEILAFAGLYHDIAKGRGGDHAVKGISIAERDLKRFGKSQSFIREVCWLVEEHLLLSAAAFRENPRSPRTWRGLIDKGVVRDRLRRLAAFTVADIRATNPEAWTPWKERLMFELIQQLEKPETDSLVKFATQLKRSGVESWERISEALDPFLIDSLPAPKFVADIRLAATSKVDLPPFVVRTRAGSRTWIRFHSGADRPGLFLRYVEALAHHGFGVRHASILTDPELGVYDWFEVKTSKTLAQIQKQILLKSEAPATPAPAVSFDIVEIVTRDSAEWVVSFRGRDQRGALAAAGRALFDAGAEIHWAKVHTWGRQIDDVFGISPSSVGAESFLGNLKKQLGLAPSF